MIEKPPSEPADHAQDFSRRYAEDLDIVAGQAMMYLGRVQRRSWQSAQKRESCSRRWKLAGMAVSPFKSRLCQPVGPIPSPGKGMARAHQSRVGQFAVEWPRLIRNFNPLVRQ